MSFAVELAKISACTSPVHSMGAASGAVVHVRTSLWPLEGSRVSRPGEGVPGMLIGWRGLLA